MGESVGGGERESVYVCERESGVWVCEREGEWVVGVCVRERCGVCVRERCCCVRESGCVW